MNLVTNVDIMHCITICFLNLQPVIYIDCHQRVEFKAEHGVVKPEGNLERDESWSH